MMALSNLLKFVLASVAMVVAGHVRVELFEHRDFEGPVYGYGLEECKNFRDVGEKISSIRMEGSCLKYYSKYDCKGSEGMLTYPNTSIGLLVKGTWNDRFRSARACPSHFKTMQCPPGSFVRKMDFSGDNLRQGITIYCYEPRSKYALKIFNTLGRRVTNVSSTVACAGAVVGVKCTKNRRGHVITEAEGFCNYQDSIEHGIFSCDQEEALVGLEVTVENHTKLIKKINPICGSLAYPTEDCTAEENFAPVLICDNEFGQTPLDCKLNQHVGFFSHHAMSESEEKERNFYMNLGLSMSARFFNFVFYKFRANFGYSQKSHYNWTSSVSNLRMNETRVQINATAKPGRVTQIEQLVGSCGDFGVNVNYFRIRDIPAARRDQSTTRPLDPSELVERDIYQEGWLLASDVCTHMCI